MSIFLGGSQVKRVFFGSRYVREMYEGPRKIMGFNTASRVASEFTLGDKAVASGNISFGADGELYSKEKETLGSFTDSFQKLDEKTYLCPNNKKLIWQYEKTNRSGSSMKDSVYECEDCRDCSYQSNCKKYCQKKDRNRVIAINEEWKSLKKEALLNLTSELGNTLKINRSIQVEGAFGVIKEDMHYRRLHHRSLIKVEIEFYLIALGYNLRKYHHQLFPGSILPN